MSGQQPPNNQPPPSQHLPRGLWTRPDPSAGAGAAPSPIQFRPPSPWAPSPPPIISGPRFGGPASRPSTLPLSPLFGAPAGQRGTRGPQISCPRPQWPQQRPVSPNHTYQPPAAPYTPFTYGGALSPAVPQSPQQFGGGGRLSPVPPAYAQPPIVASGPKPFYRQSTYSPRASPIICQTPGTPPEFLYSSGRATPSQQQYDYRQPSPQHQQLHQQFVGAPLEPPPSQPKSYVIYDDDEEQGPSTAEIIANQSQDYVDERLAEFQMTIYQLQEEQERVQKKTFVNWINSYLSKRVPPLRIADLIHDLRDGTKLLALLEVLSGEKLPMEKGRVLRRPHFLSNANTALQYLASKRIKLVNINPADLVDGRPPVVLGLIWTIILYFQIEENSRALEYLGHGIGGSVSSLDSVSISSAANASASTTTVSDMKAEKWKQGARKTLLNWVTNALPKDSGVEVRDFGASWRDGVAFLALIDSIKANLINQAEMKKASNKQRLNTAFDVAESKLGIARLLDAEDVDVEKPDEKSIMTYVAQFLHKYPEPKGTGRDGVSALQEDYTEFAQWLQNKTTQYDHLIRTKSFSTNFADYAAAKAEVDGRLPLYNKIRTIVESHHSHITLTAEAWQEIDKLWHELQIQLLYWLWLLDAALPGDFGQVGRWLADAEKLLYDNELPEVMNEETASIISRKLEEHKQFFAGYDQIVSVFRQAMQSPQLVAQIPSEQLLNMEKRLFGIAPLAAQRRIRLKYLEHKCCLIAFMELVETKLRQWTVKYGREPQAVQLLEQYKNFVSRNKIFQEFGTAFVNMQQVVVEYKRDGDVSHAESYDIDRFLRETEEKWKSVSTELRCCQNLLEESVANWRRWNENAEPFAEWLHEAEQKLHHGTEDDRLEFFQNISSWKDRHQVLSDSVQFLVATCTDDIAQELRSAFANMNGRFEQLFAHTKHYMHAGDLLRNRQDYRAGAEKVAEWLRNADAVLSTTPLGSVEQIKEYGEQLQRLAAEIDDIDEVFKNSSRIIQAMVPDLSRDEVDRMLGTLKQQKEALVRVRAQIPVRLHMFHQLLTQQESLEQGQRDINQWLNDAEELLQTLSLDGGNEQVNEQLTRHRNFFSRTLYYKSMLESKNKVFQTLLKSVERVDHTSGADAAQRMQQLNDRFAYVTQNAQQWEQRLKEAGRCWQNFNEAERVVSEWLAQAEILLSERHVESKQAIETQKMFFDNVNERWMSDLVAGAQDLLKALPTSEHQPIVEAVDRMQTRWKHTLSAAHLHVVRLEFRLEESNFSHYIKDVEKEIHLEQQALNKNEDVDTILRRNQDYFKNRGTVVAIEQSLQNMDRIQKAYAQFAPTSDEGLSPAFQNAEQQWERVAKEIEQMRTALQQIPAQWDQYHGQFAEMQSWMDVVDGSLKNIIKEVDSMDEFERERIVFQNICHEADSKREHMKWLVKTLDSLLPYATPTEADNEQKALEALIARYKNLIPTIEVTMVKTEVFSKCYTYRREVHEVVCLLNKVKDQTVNAPPPDSLDRVNKMIQEQQYAISQLDHQRTHIMSMLQRGRDLSKDVHAPAFVNAEVRTLESGWNQAYNETVDKLKALKGTQTVWSDFQEQKQSIVHLLGTAEGELRSITPLQTDPKNVSSDLKNKRELNVALQSASQQMIGRLHELCGDLVPLADPTKRPVLEREVTEIEKQFFNTMEHVKDRVSYLEDYSAKWNSYKERLAELQAWASQTAPQLIEAIQAEDISPEERVAKANALRAVISEKMRALDMLGSDASELAPKEGNYLEAKRLKGEVFKLQETMSAINRNVDHQAQAVREDLSNWQQYQAGIQEIRPWIEQSETRNSLVSSKPTTLQEAVQLQKQASEFEAQCDAQLQNLHSVAAISNQMACKTNAPDELDAVHSRWSAVHENARQITGKFERLVAGWQSFDTDMSKLEQWICDNERAIGKRPVLVNTPYVEKLEKELAKLKLYNNEISEKQAKLVSLTQVADQICQSVSAEGVGAIKERVGLVKKQTTQLSELVRSRINDVSDAIMSRQDFNARMANFGNWMAQLRSQMVNAEEVSTDRVDHVLHSVHGMLQEHQDKQPAFNAIHEEVVELTASATPEESLIINNSYTTLVGQYEDIERELQSKKAALEKWNELVGWKNEMDQNVSHIRPQLEKPTKVEVSTLSQLVKEIESMTKSVEPWKIEARTIDDQPVVHLKDSQTRRPLNATQMVTDVENQLQALQLKSQGQMNVLNKMEKRKEHFTVLQNQLAHQLQQNRQRLNEILAITPDFSNIDQIISDLVALNEAINGSSDVRGKIHDEGAILMRDDVASMPAIQESILVLDKEWDALQQEITERIQRYSVISQGLKEYADAKDRFRKDIGRANDLIASVPSEPTGEQQLLQTADKTKRALEQIRKSKVTLDEFERRGQAMLTMFGSLEQSVKNDIASELTDAHNEWQLLHDQIARNAHLYETEAVIWTQIDDGKNELQLWLSETEQSLCDAADNTLEIEFGPIRLNKYESELPGYRAMQADIIEKITELTSMNGGNPIPALAQLNEDLEHQFQSLADNAERLQSIASTFGNQEKDLRAAIKTSGEAITKLRETLIKCDDMSGDNTKIMQRLQNCSSLKDQLFAIGSDVDNLRVRVDEMRNTYPTFGESIIPKELSNVQKRYDAILIHSSKIERSLLQFLNKFHTDKIGMLQRMIRTQRDKIAWCVPEPSSDRYNLEVKKASLNDVQKGITECETRKSEVDASMAMLDKLEQPEVVKSFVEQIAGIESELSDLRTNYAKTLDVLDRNIDLWNKYETNSEQTSAWLKDIEAKLKTESSNQIELQSVSQKLADLESYASDIAAKQPDFGQLEQIAKQLTETNGEARVEHFVSHLVARHQNALKNVQHQLEHVRSVHDTYAAYQTNHEACKEWVQGARLQLNELARMGSPGSGPTGEQLGNVKNFVKELPNGQLLLNASVDSGESLYSSIVPENREQIRQQLRELHDSFDNVHDDATSLLAEVESVLLQKNSIEESYSQVKNWLNESQVKFGTVELYPTLSDKKAALQKFRAQLQDNVLHRSALTQLQNKATSLNDEEAEQRVVQSIQEYDSLTKVLNERIATAENHVVNHQTYDQILEKSQDWLTEIKSKAIDFLNEATFEKEGAEEKLIVVENMIQQKPEGEKIFSACQKQLETVLMQTHPSGHPALINAFELQRTAWNDFIGLCEASQNKLQQLCSKWDEFDSIIDELDGWLKQTEIIVKDQSLKSTWEKKAAHLQKLQAVNAEIDARSADITKIVQQGHEIEGETDLNLRVSRLNTRYQTLKNLCRESIAKYEIFTKDHKSFIADYDTFKTSLMESIANLDQNSEIIGDYTVLQQRQQSIRELADSRINDSTVFEALIDRGEKLYAHTSPDGREFIRQQLRNLRTSWDNLTDDLNATTQKIDQCLLQFGEFTVAQEQLAKWLRDVEKSIQTHTELKPTLQEKRAQLQNHKLMHQEIMSHNALVDAVCDKAQHLIDETKDASLNVYLTSIKSLFADIVHKSEDLLENLEGSSQAHHNFNVQVSNLKSWLNEEREKLLECEDTVGEKNDINRKLNSLALLKKNREYGDKLLGDLLEQYDLVKVSTAPKGVEILDKELNDIRASFANHFTEIEAIELKQRAILKQWSDFDSELDQLTKWCRSTEAIFRDQPLQSSIDEKLKQLALLKEHRDEIVLKQKAIDQFMDHTHTLLNNSGADRIKTLTSQLTNRYQLLQVLSKEVVNRWQTLSDDHQQYVDKLNETNAWIGSVETHLATANSEDPGAGSFSNLLQILKNEREQAEPLLTTVTTLGEKALPETSTQGREKIRQELREVRERWDALDEAITLLQKRQEAQTLQWSSYSDILQQTQSWLETMEHTISQENPNTWTSPQEIRSKLFRYKATAQEIASHKRIIESVNEKALALIQASSPTTNVGEVKKTIEDINKRYEKLTQDCLTLIGQLDDALDVYQQFIDLQKSQQDHQKNLWDRLASYSDYSGSKPALQVRLAKVTEIQDVLPEGTLRLKNLANHVNVKTTIIPARCKEAMSRDLTNLNVDFERFGVSLEEVKSALVSRVQQWTDYEQNLDRLISWLNDAENSLKNFTPKASLEEKQEQFNKFQALLTSLRDNENDFDKMTDDSAELIQNSGETRISVNVQQVTSRFQSIQSTAKEIVKKCEQALADHQAFAEKYKQCSNWVASAQDKYNKCLELTHSGAREDLLEQNNAIQDLLAQYGSATLLLNNTVECGERLYPSTSVEGREHIRQQLQDLTLALEQLYDNVNGTSRSLDSQLNKWSGFEESADKLQQWILAVEQKLPAEIQLHTTLDEKRHQLQVYRDVVGDIQQHRAELINLKDIAENLPERNEAVDKKLGCITNKFEELQKRANNFVERYESIVSDHQQYCKAVMDTQEFIESTHNTVDLWGDLELERVSLCTNLDRLKNLQRSLKEDDEVSRIDLIRKLGEKVIPGTVETGKVNIQSQIDCSQQEWEGLLSLIQTTVESIEAKLQQWDDYEKLKEQFSIWIRDTDTRLHSIDLRATNAEKKEQLEELKQLQGEVRARELEIDNVSEKAQQLYRGLASARYSQASDLMPKYQQVSHKVKDLNSRWQQYVTAHQEFDNQYSDCSAWLDDIKTKLDYCSDLSATSQKDLEGKLATIQDLLLLKDEGFAKVHSIVELAQAVLANTAPHGHEPINTSLAALQQDWSALALKMVDIKSSLGDSINQWSGFLEEVQAVNKTVDWLENQLRDLNQFQTTMTEKRSQLDRIRTTDEKVRLEKIDVDTLKAKASEMLASGQQSQAAYQAKQILDKFDRLAGEVKKLLADREEQYRDHRLYKEAHDDLVAWISRAREKFPAMKQRSLSDKLAIENAVAPLDSLMNKQAQGELLVEHLIHTGEVVIASTSKPGQDILRADIRAVRDSFEGLFREVAKQKEALEATLFQWRDYKEEYERLSEWLQQIDILVKNHKLALMPTLEEKQKQVKDMRSVLDRLVKGQADIDKFNASASSLLQSHLDTYVNNQLRHLNSRYQVQVNLAKDVMKKVETNHDQHAEYQKCLEKACAWIENAREVIRESSDSASVSNKEVLQQRLNKIQDLIRRREDGQSLVHTTVNNGEKVVRNTRSDGKDKINTEIRDLQADWDRLVKKMSTAKVHLETSLLQWADYSSSYSQLQQWISDREIKLQQVCEQKVAKSKQGQSTLSSGLSERKANLRQTNNIVQDIVSFEPMIQSVTSKASNVLQATPASEISTKYESLTKQARDLYEKQKEAVEQHQSLIDAENEFAQWLRNAKERLSKCSEPTGDKDALSSKLIQLTILESEVAEGRDKLNKTLEQGEIAVRHSEPEDKVLIEEAMAFLQDEFDNYVDTLKSSKNLLEIGIVKWTEYDDQYNEALEWLNQTETLVQTFNKLQETLADKKCVLEQFQGHLQTLFDWQRELDRLNVLAQSLLETCADTRISNAVTQLTTKYNALLSLAKEIMRRLELHYQEHQQHHSLYEECQYWLENTREKLNDCEEIPSSLSEVQIRLNIVKGLRQGFEQGQNKLRYAVELKEKVCMNTEAQGSAKIQEDTENLKSDFEKLLVDINDIRNKLANRASQLEDIFKQYKNLVDWLDEIEPNVLAVDSFFNELSEKRASLEKFRALQREVNSHNDTIEKINQRLEEDSTLNRGDFNPGLQRFDAIQQIINKNIENIENQVNNHELYKLAYNEIYDWLRRTRLDIQQCSDSHGEKQSVVEKLQKLKDIDVSLPEGKILMENAIGMSQQVVKTSGAEGQDAIQQEIQQLHSDWTALEALSREAHDLLNACIAAWTKYNNCVEKINDWIDEMVDKVAAQNAVDNKTPDDLVLCKQLLAEIVAERDSVEDLNDVCEVLMEQSACSRVRDQTVETQANYTKLLTSVQGLVSKVEKNLSDHTEFLNYKNEMDKWLASANETLDECSGVGDVHETQRQVDVCNSLAGRVPEGQHLLGLVTDAFTKATNLTPDDKQDVLRDHMTKLRESWDEFTMRVQDTGVMLKAALSRWEDYIEVKQRLERWLKETEDALATMPESRGELSEMKTMLERYRHLHEDILVKRAELDHLASEVRDLSFGSKAATEADEIHKLQARWERLNADCAARMRSIQDEMTDYQSYHSKLQEAERWLLQVSFQLMAHNSLYITNREQTQEQIAQHEMLLNEIQKYQTNLDDLRASGQSQIERYAPTTPTIRVTIETQLRNIQDSYNSLLNTSVQIRNRLHESLAKFQEYENTIDSIMQNLLAHEPRIAAELDEPATNLEMAQKQLDFANDLHNKLQAEKARLAVAVQACEAATASISRPSSPLESALHPIPERELIVRAKLEDLLDQVQSHLCGLSTTVSELEQQQKQRSELTEWIRKQQVAVNDWASRPSKLRPETAKQELACMNDLLVTVGDKRSQLITEMTGTFSDDDTTDIEQLLDILESDLMNTLARKTSGQCIIDAYRAAIADMHTYFDSTIKRADVLDRGSGLNAAQKLASIAEIKNEFDDQGPVKMTDLRQKAHDVTDIISNLDGQQVEEQLKSIERRYNDVSKRLDRKAQVFEVTNRGVDGIKGEIGQLQKWVQDQIAELQLPHALGAGSKSAETRLAKLKALTKEADAKQALADTLDKRVANMQHELEPLEHTQLETELRNLHASQKQLADLIRAEISAVGEASQTRKKFENDLDKARQWLKSKLAEVRKIAIGYQPLKSSAVSDEIQVCKSAEVDLKEFSDGLLQDVISQGSNILKDCPADEQAIVQKLLDEINVDHRAVRDEIASKAKTLADLLTGRQSFESDVVKLTNWLNEADAATASDVRTTNQSVLEEQLSKYQRLSDECNEMGGLLTAITEQGRGIVPTLSNAEKLKLNELLKTLKDRYGKLNTNILNKIRNIQDLMRKYKDDRAKLSECMQFMAAVQQEIRDLNKPVGSKAEDVQNLLDAYERILGDLKQSKAKISDLQGLDHLPEVPTIITQQDNLIKTIEDQLAHLRQLLSLREQFISLINEIIAFIVKYTSVITDIEKCPDSSIEDKITRYSEVILKIQECEALLAAANDKGQQIAAEGNAADQNSITEQLQSLKQQLQHLRKLVEAQLQRHELTLAEHRKMAAELGLLLDWLHANEGTAKSRPLLDRDPDSVEREIVKHEQFAADVHVYLEKVRSIHDAAQHDVGLPGTLLEMISEGRSLMSSLPGELEDRAKYLSNSREHRIEYMALVAKFNDWVHEAEIRLQNGRHGVDFEHILTDLEEHRNFFSNDTPIKDLLTKQIQGTADRIWPSLNIIEQEELTRELQQFGQTMKSTLHSAGSLREQLERDAIAWKEYGQLAERVRSILDRATFDAGEPVKDLAGLQFSVQKITHALNDLQSQRSELDKLNERVQAILRQADPPNRERIEQQNASINGDWSEQVQRFEQRRDQLSTLQAQWESYENRVHAFDNQVIRLAERVGQVDPVVRSRRQLEDTKHVIQELLGESEQLKSTHQEVTTLSESIIAFLGEVHESEAVIAQLRGKLNDISEKYKRVKDNLHALDTKSNADLNTIERHFAAVSDLQDRINALLDAINDVYVFDADQAIIEQRLRELQTSSDTAVADTRRQISATQSEYQVCQQLVPADVKSELNALEQLAERLTAAMEAKNRDHKRAKTVRSEYLRGVDAVQQWLQQAELRIQDRTSAPLQLKETLNRIQQDLAGVQEQLEGVKRNGEHIIERSRSDDEKSLVRTTIDQLQQQLDQVVAWLGEKRHQIGDTLDAWTRFMNLYQIVMSWAKEKRTFVAAPLQIGTLLEAKQHLQVYGQAVKSVKPIVANLSEMNRELDAITQVTQVGDLRAKLLEAEEAKAEVERELLERNAFLQETAEEWEQCERKLKDVRAWIDKTGSLLDSVPHKKKPLRDQHGLCEKYLADTSIQKTKISMSVEKLQVHFRAGIGGDTKITETASAIVAELDQLAETIRAKTSNLDASLGQIDDYQRQQQQLRQKILHEEQQLRQVLAPTYLPHDRERAVSEQQACRERVKMSQAKITAILERIKLIIHRGTPDSDPLET